MKQSNKRIFAQVPALATFLILAIACYCLGYWLIFRLERATPLMMSVGFAAIVTCLLYGRSLSSLGLLWGDNRLQWASYLIPLGIATTAYFIIWGFGLSEFNSAFFASAKEEYNLAHSSDISILVFYLVLTSTFTFFLSLPSILGEEIAWRGFLVPELAKSMSFNRVALLSGVLWSMFHWPLMIKGFYGSDSTPFFFQLVLFTIFIVSNSVTMTYLRYKTNSVWSAVLYHASLNVFIQKLFTPLTVINDRSAWYADEFGIVVPCVSLLVAVYFWKRANREFC